MHIIAYISNLVKNHNRRLPSNQFRSIQTPLVRLSPLFASPPQKLHFDGLLIPGLLSLNWSRYCPFLFLMTILTVFLVEFVFFIEFQNSELYILGSQNLRRYFVNGTGQLCHCPFMHRKTNFWFQFKRIINRFRQF